MVRQLSLVRQHFRRVVSFKKSSARLRQISVWNTTQRFFSANFLDTTMTTATNGYPAAEDVEVAECTLSLEELRLIKSEDLTKPERKALKKLEKEEAKLLKAQEKERKAKEVPHHSNYKKITKFSS